jgi:N-glycosylase/DNA lyase
MRVFARDKFGALSGMAQQYLFYYARENKIEV